MPACSSIATVRFLKVFSKKLLLFIVVLLPCFLLSSPRAYACAAQFEGPPDVILSELVEDWPDKYRLLGPQERALVDTFASLSPFLIYDEHTFMELFLNRWAELASTRAAVSFEDYADHYENLPDQLLVLLNIISKKLDIDFKLNPIFEARNFEVHHLLFRYSPNPTYKEVLRLEGSTEFKPDKLIVNSTQRWAFYKGRVVKLSSTMSPIRHLIIEALVLTPGKVIPHTHLLRYAGLRGHSQQRLIVEIYKLKKVFKKLDPNFNRIQLVKNVGYYWKVD